MKTFPYSLNPQRSLLSGITSPLTAALLLACVGSALGGETPMPDLRPNDASFTGPAQPGSTVELTFTVANDEFVGFTGTLWTDRVYLSLDGTPEPEELVLTENVDGSTLTGNSYTITRTITLPEMSAGPYYLIVVADSDNDVSETDENDNTASFQVDVVAVDLRPTDAIAVAGQLRAGEVEEISYTVLNEGMADIDPFQSWYDEVYLSADATLDTNEDTHLVLVSEGGPLASGVSYSNTRTVTVPPVAPGEYYLIVVADDYLGNGGYVPEGDESDNVASFPVTVVAPDLRPTGAIAVAGQLRAGETEEITYSVANEGSGEIASHRSWSDEVYLSADTTLDTNVDTQLCLVGKSGGLPPNEPPYSETRSVSVPPLPPGQYYLIVVTDDYLGNGGSIYESDENDNVDSFPVTVVAPDLRPTAASAVAGQLRAGETEEITYSVVNEGSGEIAFHRSWYDEVYLSADTTLDINVDTQLCLVGKSGGRPPNEPPYSETRSVSVPSLPPGQYYLIVVTDDYFGNGGSIYESDENDNVDFFPVTVVAPDLRPTAASAVAGQLRVGETEEITYSVVNEGSGEIPSYRSWYDEVYLSADATLDTNVDTPLVVVGKNGPLLPTDPPYSETRTVTVPTVASGDYYLIVVTDDYFGNGGHITESDENDNVAAYPVTVVAPDLRPTLCTITGGELHAGESAEISYTILNEGNGEAPVTRFWSDRVFFSTDAILDENDAVYNAGHGGPVAAGTDYSQSATINTPAVAPGTYYLIVQTDYNGNLLEGQEDDNIAAFQVTVVAPDLRPTLCTATGGELRAGEPGEISYTILNEGSGEAPATRFWSDRVFFSTDAILDENDAVYNGGHGGPVAPGSDYSQSATINTPEVLPGIYYLIVQTDYNENLFEGQEVDNIAAFPVTVVVPDLASTAMDLVAGTPAPSALLTVKATVTNVGTASLTEFQGWFDRIYLSNDSTLDGGDAVVSNYFYKPGPIAIGESYDYDHNVTLPELAIGTYYLITGTDTEFDQIFEADEANNTAVALAIKIGPDLEPVAATVSSGPAISGRSVQIHIESTNSGNEDLNESATWFDNVYLSSDTSLDNGDALLGTVSNSGPFAAGATNSHDFVTTLPIRPSGSYYLLLSDDGATHISEASETNNIAAYPVQVVSPDLTVVSVTPSGSQAHPGAPFDVGYAINNSGDGPITGGESWTDEIYISTDATWSVDDTLLGGPYTENGPLASSVSYSRSRTVTIPTVAPGNYFLITRTDGGDAVIESSDSNNTGSAPIEILAPDLDPISLTPSGEILAGRPFQVSVTMKNNGSSPAAGSWTDTIHLSTDNTLGMDDTLLDGPQIEAGPLAAGDEYTRLRSITTPVAAGNYFLIVSTDTGSSVTETDEANNIQAFAITVRTLDLAPTSVIASGPLVAGFDVDLTVTVTNGGNGTVPAAPPWTDNLYLSADAILDGSDTLIGGPTGASGPLASGASYVITYTVTTAEYPAGTRYLIATTDIGDTVLESNEGNNQLAVPVTITNVNLDPDTLALTSGSPFVAGQNNSISYTVTNEGASIPAAGAWNDSVYLSTDAIYDAGDTLIGGPYAEPGPLANGNSYTRSRTVTTTGIPGGTYYLILVTDRGGSLYESDENDNSIATQIEVYSKPDLRPTAAAPVDPVLQAGQTESFQYTILNEGTSPTSGTWYDGVWLSSDNELNEGLDSALSVNDLETAVVASGNSYTRTKSAGIPNLAPGSYFLIVKADYNNNQLEENDEADNTVAFPVTIVAPDLRPLSCVAVEGNLQAGQTESITYSILNEGSGEVPAISSWYDGVWLSTDDVLNEALDVPLLGNDPETGPVAVAENYTRTKSVSVPNLAPGSYFLIVKADYYNNQLFEGDEADNTVAFAVTIVAPDLRPLSCVAVDSELQAGQTEGVTYTIRNEGSGEVPAASSWYDGVWLSEDDVLNEALDSPLSVNDQELGPVAVATNYTRTKSVSVPNLAPGAYFLIVKADYYNNQLFEGDEADNVVAFPVTVVAPDLQPTSLAVTSGIPDSGAAVDISYTITNSGAGAVPPNSSWHETLWVSADPVLDGGDAFLGYGPQVTEQLTAGASYNRTVPATLPPLANGTWYLIVNADGYSNTLFEGDETNNTRTLSFAVVDTLAKWTQSHGLTGDDAGPHANPSGDGIENLLKYAYGLDPNHAYADDRYLVPGSGTVGLPSITVLPEPRLRVEYVRRRHAPDLTYSVLFSADLVDWEDSGGTPVVTIIDHDWERVVVVDAKISPITVRFGKCVATHSVDY